jgi:hypothetical protein
MNHPRLPKEVLLPEWARWDKQGKKGDGVYWGAQNIETP